MFWRKRAVAPKAEQLSGVRGRCMHLSPPSATHCAWLAQDGDSVMSRDGRRTEFVERVLDL